MSTPTPIFVSSLKSKTYWQYSTIQPLDGTAIPYGESTVTYQWQQSIDSLTWTNIVGATNATYQPSSNNIGVTYYRVNATNIVYGLYPSETLYPSNSLYPNVQSAYSATATSNAAAITVKAKVDDYNTMLRTPFTKLCRLRFLQPDGSTAFALDNNPLNRRSGAFIQSGSLTVNLQNGQRRSAEVTLSNLDGEFDYNINHIWFGQQIALDEGLILSDGSDYYIPQGVFYIANPQETFEPNQRTMTFPLVDKWAYLDGTLYGNLEGTYEVEEGTNIFTPITALLLQDKGNGYAIDNVPPIFTEYYNTITQTLPDGTIVPVTNAPYTFRVDSESGTIAEVILGLAAMINAWVGYDATGALRIDPSQDDIIDTNKPVLWQFGMDETQLLGASYTVNNQDVYNDYIIIGEQISDYSQAYGRAQNHNPASDTNIELIGHKIKRESATGYYTAKQCQDLAEWKLKRSTILQKSISISCNQMFHINENSLVTIIRTDKNDSPMERHLVQGFSRPLAATGSMTIDAVSVNDLNIAVVSSSLPVKGDIIEMDLGSNIPTIGLENQYRVLNIEGNVATVVAMFTPTAQMVFGTDEKYAGSTVDTYLNTTWYNSLSESAKSAILQTNITQDKWDDGTIGSSDYLGIYLVDTDGRNYRLDLIESNYQPIGNRYVYSLSIQDIINYLEVPLGEVPSETTLTYTNIWKMLCGSNARPRNVIKIRLRSAYSDTTNVSSVADCYYGRIGTDSLTNQDSVCPVFRINLSNITWFPV